MSTKQLALVSGGSYKFHMAPLAAELERNGDLAGYITAGWPMGWQESLARLFPSNEGWRRFLDRKEAISDSLVFSNPAVELILKIGDKIFAARFRRTQQRIHRIAFLLYEQKASNLLTVLRPDIYHFRNCYGGKSIEVAGKLGIPSVCDHSIAHPIVLHYMENNRGSWPTQEEIVRIQHDLSPLEIQMLNDLQKSEYLLVNSEFVKESCLHAGWSGKKIFVAYLGIDDGFLRALESESQNAKPPANHEDILFAGGWQRRKGVETLIDATKHLCRDWRLTVAGGMDDTFCRERHVREFISNGAVNILGLLPRNELAKEMQRHRVFVFPSYCEGSARVVFEALAAGCYVITTPNSGSIVESGVHGALVPAGDAKALASAIDWALENPDRVNEVGMSNRKLVATKYLQRNYGARIREIYTSIQTRPMQAS